MRAVDLAVAALGAADPQRAEAALVVGRDRDVLEDTLDLVVGEAVSGESLARCRGHHLLRARARGHALSRYADEATRSAFGCDGRAMQRVNLLRRHTADRR